MNVKLNRLYLLIVLGIYMITLVHMSRNLFTPYLWFDEAGQFWISKGLNHDSDPMSKVNGLMEVVENNKYYNIDPGGFSILLHFWTYVSDYHIWVRLLPFLFFIGVVVSFIYLSNLWIKDINVALLTGFIPIFIPVVLSMGFEVRAYSMESLGTVMSIIALEKLRHKLTNKHLFLWSCVFAFFMTSRYSEIIIVFVVSLVVLSLIFRTGKPLKQKFVSVILYAIPLVVTLISIYYFALVYQNKSAGALVYLRYLSHDLKILLEPKNIVALYLVALLLVLYYLRKKYPILQKYQTLIIVTLFTNGLFIILSFLGKHPWDFSADRSSRCISLILLFGLCISAFTGELLKSLFKSHKVLNYSLVLSVLMIIIYVDKSNIFPRPHDNHNLFYNTYYHFKKADIYNYQRIYVDRREGPPVRYLFEYGALKSKRGNGFYPDRFTFVKYGHHHTSDGKEIYYDFYKSCPKMNDLLDYDFMITPELWSWGNNDKWIRIDGTDFFVKKKPQGNYKELTEKQE